MLLGLTVRPLAEGFFGFDNARLDLLTVCTWAFLVGLVGDTWLEVAVRSYYANLNTRIPLLAAFVQAVSFILISAVFSPIIGLAGIPLAAAVTFTVQAIVLLILLNRRFPGLLQIGNTATRGLTAALLAGGTAIILQRFLPLSSVLAALVALVAGSADVLPVIWRELRLLFSL